MGRELRRVPMDFKYPHDYVWYGYLIDYITLCYIEKEGEHDRCDYCKKCAEIKGVPFTEYGCPDWDTYLAEPIAKLKELLAQPNGEGYQLWETTSEGSPISPVFATLDKLCEWCEPNATTFADIHVSKERWKQLLTEHDGWVAYEDHGVVII